MVGQIIPFNFPLLMAAWKLAPALAAGNCSVIKPASPTPWSILKLMELIEEIVPPGVINVVNGPGAEIGKALATNKRIAKIAFTGETATGRLIMQYAAQNIIPSTTELGGKSPNIFFADVMAADDAFLDKAVEGLVLYAFNKGEVCTCPSRALIEESIYDAFMERRARADRERSGRAIRSTRTTQIGAQVSTAQLEKIESYVKIGLDEGAELLIGGERAHLGGELEDGYYFQPTVFKGDNDDADLPGGDLRPGARRDDVQGRGRRHSRSRTTRCTASAPASGRATRARPTGWAAASRPGACGRTATTSTPRTRPSAATRSPASGARTTR